MHHRSLLLALLGVLALIIGYVTIEPISITNAEQLVKLPDNTLIRITGTVLKETPYEKQTTLLLDNNISIRCQCSLLVGKRITVTGYLDTFKKPYIHAVKVQVNDS